MYYCPICYWTYNLLFHTNRNLYITACLYHRHFIICILGSPTISPNQICIFSNKSALEICRIIEPPLCILRNKSKSSPKTTPLVGCDQSSFDVRAGNLKYPSKDQLASDMEHQHQLKGGNEAPKCQ